MKIHDALKIMAEGNGWANIDIGFAIDGFGCSGRKMTVEISRNQTDRIRRTK